MSSRACTLAADAIVVFVTWWNTYKSYKIQQEAEIGPSLARVMLWNGSLYFIVLAGLSIVHIALTALEIDAIFIDDSYANPFIYPISSILVCHFLLNLRQVDVDPASESHSQSMSADDLRFAAVSAGTLPRFIASLGEPVHVYEPESVDAIYDASDEGALDDLVRTQAGDCVADQGDRLGSITEETG
ncbi:hypothetical protein BD309DRAFT_967754 [Dichomitus squalens]|nr:hypothetical protein BD309DRAFT_967754 [Dichomitus squalens]